MKLQNDNEDEYRGISVRMPTVILVASVAIFLVLAVVVASNGGNKKKHSTGTNNTMTQIQEDQPVTVDSSEGERTASDLDFWDMYRDGTDGTSENEPVDDSTRKEELEQREAEMKKEEGQDEVIPDNSDDNDPSKDGKHTKVVHRDGKSEWIAINSSLKLNDYDDTLFQSNNGIITYTSGNQKISQIGADISQYTTSVDWDQLATEVDYVMIRVGARGYDTGKIIADTKFVEYVKAAVEHDIPFGVYFSSQAISLDEAKEEAAYVTGQLQIIRDEINNPKTVTENKTEVTPGTTVTTDGLGNVVTTTVDQNGNSTIVVTNSENKVVSTTTINSDAYGNTSTVVKDGNGNTRSTKLEQKDQTTGVTTVTTTTYNDDDTITTTTETIQPTTSPSNTTQTVKHEFALNYPIAVDMHFITNDTARIERISKTEKTNILMAFCDEVEKSGYNSMIYANKEFLLCQLNQNALSDCDIWLLNEGNLPDYPYMLSMWKYATAGGKLKSLTGDYGLDVGFIDYSLR